MRKSSNAVTMPRDPIGEPPSIAAVMVRARREHLRWLSLVHLDAARPERIGEEALLASLRSVYPDASARELRRELDYLVMQNMMTIKESGKHWHLALTWQGIDLVEYTSACPAGIGRPFLPS